MNNKAENRNNTFSVAIPTYCNDALLDRILRSLCQQNFPENLVDIMVISNGPRTDARAVVARFSHRLSCTYHAIDQVGLSAARNFALKATQANFVVFFDNDMLIRSGCLEAYGEAIQCGSLRCFYGGPVLADYEFPPRAWLLEYLPWSAKNYSLGDSNKLISEAAFLGGNHAVPREATLNLGGYDEGGMVAMGGAIGEETRLQKKLIAAGLIGVYLSRAQVYHFVPESKCSAKWALHRNFRSGLTKGLYGGEQKTKNNVLGVPFWVVFKYLKFIFRLIGAYFRYRKIEKYYKYIYHAEFYRGMIAGSFKRKNFKR